MARNTYHPALNRWKEIIALTCNHDITIQLRTTIRIDKVNIGNMLMDRGSGIGAKGTARLYRVSVRRESTVLFFLDK